MNFLILLLSALATWRICNLIIEEPGPFHIFEKLRTKVGLTRVSDMEMPEQIMFSDREFVHNGEFFAELIECIMCLSVWVGAVISIYLAVTGLIDWRLVPIYAVALSAITILIKNRRLIDG